MALFDIMREFKHLTKWHTTKNSLTIHWKFMYTNIPFCFVTELGIPPLQWNTPP